MTVNLENASVFSVTPNTTLQFPLNHGRILYNNIIANADVTVDGGVNEIGVLIPNTADRWQFNNTAQMIIDLPVNQEIDTLCIGAHTLKGYGVRVEFNADDSATFFEFAPQKSITRNESVMFHRTTSVTVSRIRLTFTGVGLNVGAGVIYAGIALQMERPYFSGSTPSNLDAQTAFYNARTETGSFVGREIRKMDFKASPSWKNLTDSWYREFFQPFVECARALPFFYAWNLLEHPSDVGFFITSGDISPSYMGVRDLVQVSSEFVGVG